jgi:hypothetical protein
MPQTLKTSLRAICIPPENRAARLTGTLLTLNYAEISCQARLSTPGKKGKINTVIGKGVTSFSTRSRFVVHL